MNKIIPFFELNGQRYEIKPTRYLLAEHNKLGKEIVIENDDKANAIKAQALMADIRKYANKAEETWRAFEEEPNVDNQKIYLLFKDMYDKSLEELAKLEAETNSTTKVQKAGIDLLEKIAIKGLAEQYFNFDENKAKALWESRCDDIGNNATVEWLSYMGECFFGDEEEGETDPFLAQMRKRRQTKKKK